MRYGVEELNPADDILLDKIVMESPVRLVKLQDIDQSEGPYCMSFGFSLKPLVHSIRNVGLVNSLLAIEKCDGSLTLFAGYRRLKALKILKWAEVPCRVFSESQVSPFQCLLINLNDNLVTRTLNEVEKGMVLSRLIPFLPKPRIIRHFMPLIGLPSHEATFLSYVRLAEEMDEEGKSCLVQGRISMETARAIIEMDRSSGPHLFGLISKLRLNMNQQKQLIEYITELANIERKSIDDLFKEYSFEAIYSDACLNRPQKAKAILTFLRARRYPSLAGAEDTFHRMVSRLELPDDVRISFPPFFEAPHYRIEVSFREGKELKEKLKLLSHTEGLEGLGDPWRNSD